MAMYFAVNLIFCTNSAVIFFHVLTVIFDQPYTNPVKQLSVLP